VHDFEFRNLLVSGKPAHVADHIAGEPIEWLLTASKRQFKSIAALSGPLDREYSARGRVEQSYLRGILFGNEKQAKCALCGRTFPTSLLVAAHIKPRSECSRGERLDERNVVFAACLLGCDSLYERGLLGVGSEGQILLSDEPRTPHLRMVLKIFNNSSCPAWNEETKGYFAWHRERRFQGTRVDASRTKRLTTSASDRSR
jgi:hypothetical protein